MGERDSSTEVFWDPGVLFLLEEFLLGLLEETFPLVTLVEGGDVTLEAFTLTGREEILSSGC